MDSALKCDLLKGLLFVVCVQLLTGIDTSKVYHMVRAQTLIKLYLIYNMLEVSEARLKVGLHFKVFTDRVSENLLMLQGN